MIERFFQWLWELEAGRSQDRLTIAFLLEDLPEAWATWIPQHVCNVFNRRHKSNREPLEAVTLQRWALQKPEARVRMVVGGPAEDFMSLRAPMADVLIEVHQSAGNEEILFFRVHRNRLSSEIVFVIPRAFAQPVASYLEFA